MVGCLTDRGAKHLGAMLCPNAAEMLYSNATDFL